MATVITNIRKLQKALMMKGEKLGYDTHQFYSQTQDRFITMYTISKAVENDKGTSNNIKLFTSASQSHILFYLRDYWFYINNQPIPTEDIEWNKAKKRYGIEFPPHPTM